ncbi:hypothetical protein ACE38W_03075 [Chitinophaga sp. Hz27]|uniref:hypothetical protein n=1 Tax=Chitinophaga sp. Hz27 TaxID=3347169 RepID=UPI0035DFD317
MNLAIGAILLTILLIPPLIFYYFYFSGTHARAAPKYSIPEFMFVSSIASLVIHCSIIRLGGYNINFELLFRILAGQMTDHYIATVCNKLPQYFYQFTAYCFWISIGAAVSGWLVSWFVKSAWLRSRSWIKKIRNGEPPTHAVRYYNNWWYYFCSHEYSSSGTYRIGDSHNVLISILVETKEASIIYEGILYDWITNGESLDRIYLKKAISRISSVKALHEAAMPLDSQVDNLESDEYGILCIPYSKVTNIHLRFLSTRIQRKIILTAEEALTSFIEAIEEDDLPILQFE